MAAWKIAPALAAGNTIVLKPAETTPLSALAWRKSAPKPICRRRAQHRHRRRRRREPRSSRTAGSTRSRSPARPRSASRSSAGAREFAHAAHARTGRQGRQHHLRRRAARRRRSKASCKASTSIKVTSAAPARDCSSRSRSTTRSSRRLAERIETLRIGDPARQEHRHRRDQLARPARAHPTSSSQAASPRARRCTRRRATLPARGLFFPASFFTGRRTVACASRARRSSARYSRS